MDDVRRRRGRMVAREADDRAVERQAVDGGVELLDRALLHVRILRVPGCVGRLLVAEDEGVARGEPLARELDAVPQVGDGVLAFGRVDRLEAERRAQAAQERGVGDEAPAQTVSLDEARVLARATPPLER